MKPRSSHPGRMLRFVPLPEEVYRPLQFHVAGWGAGTHEIQNNLPGCHLEGVSSGPSLSHQASGALPQGKDTR